MCEKTPRSAEERAAGTFPEQLSRILDEYLATCRLLMERQRYRIQEALSQRRNNRAFSKLSGQNENGNPRTKTEPEAIDTKKKTKCNTSIADRPNEANDGYNYEASMFLRNENAATGMSYYSKKNSSLPRRRPYTASELASAVRAICSGQLGTRRAASVYGIPRSTLRNKICKLNEIRKLEENRLGGKPIPLAEFIKHYSSTSIAQQDALVRKNDDDFDRYSSGRVASIFKVNCRATPREQSNNNSSAQHASRQSKKWDMEDAFARMRTGGMEK